MIARRIRIQWTKTAKESLKKLPRAARKGLLDKADALLESDDPKAAGKPLTGPLQGYYRIRHSRYRAIYTVREEKLTRGEVLIHVTIMFVAVGKRKQSDKADVYTLATRLVALVPRPPTKRKRTRKKKPPRKRRRE